MKTPNTRRVTQTDIAHQCGYHPSTISLALRGHPTIPDHTQKEIRRVAEKMGYRPDPALASLIAYRSSANPKRHSGAVIAVISDAGLSPTEWRENHPTYSEYWYGMCEQAEALGYSLFEASIGYNREKVDRVNSILGARGISAVIITPLHNLEKPIHLDWNRLSAVSLGFTLVEPVLPHISHAHQFGAMLAVEKLYALGYRRPALVIPYNYDQRVHHGWTAGFLAGCHVHGMEMEPLLYLPRQYTNLLNSPLRLWIEEQKPDVILTAQFQVLRYLQATGFEVPDRIGYAFLDCETCKPEISGIVQNSRQIGRQAINVVSHAYINFLRGIPDDEESHLISGSWQPGETLCPQEIATKCPPVRTCRTG